jgi:hypothetical protein
MSIVAMTRTLRHLGTSGAPYASGSRIRAVDADGERYVGRVASIKPTKDGHFTVVAELREPRHLRGHLLTAVVDSAGNGPGIEP